MTRTTRNLLTVALALPPDERAKFAAELLESLHETQDDIDAAWAAEIQRRVAAAGAGSWKALTGGSF